MEIKIRNLSKSFGKKEVLKNVNLTFENGMYGLLGPNGAGKTTLMRILTTLLSSNSGEIKFDNIDIKEKSKIREIIGYLPQEFSMYGHMTCFEALDYIGVLSGIKNKSLRREKVERLLEEVNLLENKKTRVRALSGGMRRRLGIAQALINDPKLLIVDEPTAGLDPEERIRFRNLLRDVSENRIVILSTHIVEDVEFTCENLALLKEGEILFSGKVNELIEKVEGEVWSINIDRNELDNIRKKYTVLSTVSENQGIRVRVLSKNSPMEGATCVSANIEDAYMKAMKEGQ